MYTALCMCLLHEISCFKLRKPWRLYIMKLEHQIDSYVPYSKLLLEHVTPALHIYNKVKTCKYELKVHMKKDEDF